MLMKNVLERIQGSLFGKRRISRLEKRLAETEAQFSEMFHAIVPKLLDANPQGFDVMKLASGRGAYFREFEIVRNILPRLDFRYQEGDRADCAFLWGSRPIYSNVRAVTAALKSGCPLLCCEDGFLRSADTWANTKFGRRYNHGCSIVFDSLGYYYDATRASEIENMLNDKSLVVSAEQRAEARRLIDRIVAAKLTKYNHQPIYTPELGRPGHRKVLVIDQSYGDFAIRKGWGSEQTFADMLADAIRDNPDADILVKTHPDTMTGKRAGYYDEVREGDNIFRVTFPVNPYSLMELVDKVYVCSTQLGFEALMAGKDVHVYGMPFYAGWGLTVDSQRNPRRTNTRSLEEVFYIFYVLYTHWYDSENGTPCSIDTAIDNLIKLREEYRRLQEGR